MDSLLKHERTYRIEPKMALLTIKHEPHFRGPGPDQETPLPGSAPEALNFLLKQYTTKNTSTHLNITPYFLFPKHKTRLL